MKLFRLLFIPIFFSLSSPAQFGMPSFKEVATQFFSRYTNTDQFSYLGFQRKKEGWWVVQNSFEDQGTAQQGILFWSKKSGSYLDTGFPAFRGDSSEVAEIVSDYLGQISWDYQEYAFERNLYYGYPGWDWDVIQTLSADPPTTDTLLESLARAYSNYASGFITEQYGDLFINNDTDRVEIKPSEPISRSRINKFMEYDLRAIATYKKLQETHPGYTTRVGNISIKLANEYIFMYSELMMAGDREKAVAYARKSEYPDSLLAVGRAYLTGLPINSILVTGGDNDTYPLWYLQEIEQYRPDVIVLNYSMLGFRKYLQFIDGYYQHSLFSVKDSVYFENNFDYFLFRNAGNPDMEIHVGTFLQDIKDQHNPYDSSKIFYKDGTIRTFYAKKIYFQQDGTAKKAFLDLGNFVYMNDYILLDMIYSHPNRPIYTSFYLDFIAGFLRLEDKVYAIEMKWEEE